MWNTPTKAQLAQIPELYATEDIPIPEKVIHLHFFIGGCDWFIAEYDNNDLFWGFAILNNDDENAEWGYISFKELQAIKVNRWLEIDCDLHWKPRKASEIDRIVHCRNGIL